MMSNFFSVPLKSFGFLTIPPPIPPSILLPMVSSLLSFLACFQFLFLRLGKRRSAGRLRNFSAILHAFLSRHFAFIQHSICSAFKNHTDTLCDDEHCTLRCFSLAPSAAQHLFCSPAPKSCHQNKHFRMFGDRPSLLERLCFWPPDCLCPP